MKSNNTEELAFEDELIEYLQHVGASRQWKYEEEIKTTNQLWANLERFLNRTTRISWMASRFQTRNSAR